MPTCNCTGACRSTGVCSCGHMGRIEFSPLGCICPPGAEKTCEGPLCPRRKPTLTGFFGIVDSYPGTVR